MYSGAIVMLFFMPFVLGGVLGNARFSTYFGGDCCKALGEEKFLAKNLLGYGEYCLKVRYRLIPFVW
jgi:protein-S-isoprenylcysteine O-methyltransferase Ste14